jgi:hypothetical protein
MELRDAILLLEYYNRWRRGEDESLDMPNPRDIGIALDTVLAAVTEGGTGNSGVERPEPSPHFLQKGDSPETDALAHSGLCPVSYIARMTDLARKLERERDEARQQEQIHYDNFLSMQKERDEARKQNSKLRDIAERVIEKIEQENWGIRQVSEFWKQIRSELDQLKEASK